MNLKLNYKIPIVFHNLKNDDSHLIMEELGKFNLTISVIPNGLENHMSSGAQLLAEPVVQFPDQTRSNSLSFKHQGQCFLRVFRSYAD